MTTIAVTPADARLFLVEISDARGSSEHEVGLTDALVERLDLGDIALRDAVAAALEFLLAREGHDQLPYEIDLSEVAERHPDLIEWVPTRAPEHAAARSGPAEPPRPAPDQPTSDERLVQQVEREQEAGQASRQDPHR